jgi:NadR type nicotinamide-nucleotide adenylyltransferase
LVVTDSLLAALPPSWPGLRAVPLDSAEEGIHRHFVADLCLHVLGFPIDAVFTSEDYGDGFAAVLSEKFRRADGAPNAVVHVCADRERATVPISASMIREDIHRHRHWLSPEVYRSFVRRVAILGGESSGKSTLAIRLAEALGTVSVAEYGRELWESRGGDLREPDLLEIARTQIAREETASSAANGWLICDTSPLTTLFYAGEMFGRADAELRELAGRRYDHTFLCAPDFPFVQDGTRRDRAFRNRQHSWYLKELARRETRAELVQGPLEERVCYCVEMLRFSACE